MAGPVRITILANARNAINGMRETSEEASKMGKSVSKVGGLLKAGLFAGAAAGVAGFVAGVKESVSAASDLTAAVGTNKQIFGEASKEVLKFGEQSAKALGLSNAETLNATKQFGNFYTAVGITQKNAAKMSTSMVTASANLAAFGDSTPTEALDSLTSALRGEYDSLQKYIPTVNAAAVEQKALEMSGKKTAKALTDQEKALALNALVMESGANKAGALEQKQGGLTVTTAKLKAQLTDMAAKVGSVVLPYLLKLANFVNDTVIPAVQAFWKDNGPGITAFFGSIGSGIKTVVGVLTTFAGLITSAFQSGPIQSLAGTLKSIALSPEAVSSVQGFVEGLKQVGTTVQEAFAKIQPIVATVVAFLAEKFASIEPQIRTIVATIGEIFSTGLEIVRAVIQRVTDVVTFVWQKFGANILKFISTAIDSVVSVIQGALNVIKGIFDVIVGVLTGDWGRAWDGVKTIAKGAVQIVVGVFNFLKAQLTLVFTVIKAAVLAAWNAIKSGTASAWNAVSNAVKTAWTNVKNAVSNGVTTAVNFVKELPGKAKTALGNLGSLLLQSGKDLIQGLINGAGQMVSSLVGKVKEIAGSAISAAKSALGIASPSKAFKQLGIYVGAGFIQGLTASEPTIISKTKSLASKVMAAFPDVTKTFYTGKGKTRRKHIVEYVNGTQNELLALIAKGNSKLTTLASKRDSITDKFTAASKRLEDLQKSRADTVASVTDTVRKSFSLVTDAEEGAVISIESILARATAAAEQARAFARNISLLKGRGLNASAINEIAQAGPAAAAESLEALVRATPRQIRQLNDQYKQIAGAGKSAGYTVASTLYDAGIKAAGGLVAGLAAQQDAIEKQMLRIATGMQKAIRKALGIHSPSRVMRDLGVMAAQGFVQGFDSVPATSLPKFSYAGGTATPAAATGAGITINVKADATTDKAALGKAIREALNADYAVNGRAIKAAVM